MISKANGGIVTRTEKDADHLLANSSRSDCPKGALSHKLIPDSISSGKFQLPDRYKIEQSSGTGTGASGNSTRVFRRLYTHEEDCRLVHLVMNDIGRENSTSLYKELAQQVREAMK